MPKLKLFVFIFIFALGFLAIDNSFISFADELSDTEKKIDSTTKKLDALNKERGSLEQELQKLTDSLSATQADINKVSGQIATMESQLAEINKALDLKRQELSAKISFRDNVIRTYYRENYLSSLEFFLLSLSPSVEAKNANLDGFQQVSQNYIAHKTLTANTLNTISFLNTDIVEYEKNKKDAESVKASLDSQKTKLASIKTTLVAEETETRQELNSLDSEIQKVNSQLSDLTSKQQELLRAKFGATSEYTTVGDNEVALSALPNPPFKPAFALVSKGYPHRVGANQYGMYGRSKAGQNYKDIIKAYFKNVEISGSCDRNKTIPVVGYGNLKLEDTYMMGIAEVPESWGDRGGQEALKAQAVLARTFALNYVEYYWDSSSQNIKKKSSKTPICTSQACQVYSGRKKTGNWKRAVEDTCGVVIKYNGNPITAWYASTAGGYTRTSEQVWGGSRPWSKGIRDAACSGNLADCAYDGPKYGNSPWFEKAWGNNPSSGSAWMKASELEDIFNAYLLSEKSSSYNQNLSPINSGGWSSQKVKDKLEDLGIEPVGKVEDVFMKDDGTGYTTSVVLKSENYSNKSFDGYKFKSIFNLRSPGSLVLWSSFYDVLIED